MAFPSLDYLKTGLQGDDKAIENYFRPVDRTEMHIMDDRAFDKDRDGFVIAAGGGSLILEELEHAKKRDAFIYAELTGYGATSDGEDMVSPSGEGAYRCMEMAWNMIGKKDIDYINVHGTSTPAGDIIELKSIKKLFVDPLTLISST